MYKKGDEKRNDKDYNPLDKLKGFYVEVYNKDLEGALKKLKRMQKRANFALELQKHEFYRKPSEIKKDKKHRSKRRQTF